MTKHLFRFTMLAVALLAVSTALMAQVSTVGTLVGTVADPTKAVIAGADVKLKDPATGIVIETKSGADGSFVIANVRPGDYIVEVTMAGFKKAEVRGVKIVVGGTFDLQVTMQVGQIESTVVVEAGAEVLETQSTTIGTTITGKAITQLPLASRDALDLAIMMPGAQTVGRPRATSFLGLPKGAINITIDGINAQDNVLKSSDGFFTIVRPRVDSIEEFSISTAAAGAEQAAEGAVQIRMETKRGTNDYHGGVWWQHRNDYFNSNYFFNNQKAPGQLETPRARQRLNQFGYKVGGPIWKEKLFFFTAFDFYRNPDARSRTRTLLTTDASAGRFVYNVTAVPGTLPAWVTCNAGTLQCTADLLAMGIASPNGAGTLGATDCDLGTGGAQLCPGVTDATVGGYLTAMNSTVGAPGVSLNAAPSPFQRSISFNNAGSGKRNFPDFRFDYNVTKNHQVSAIYHYNYFTSTPDFLNGFDASFPVAPFNTNQGSQISNRNQLTGVWRWTLAANMSNEVRFGIQSAPVSFFPDLNLSLYPQFNTSLGMIRVRPALNLVSQPLLNFSTQARNTSLAQLTENFSWTRGKHTMSFGYTHTEIRGKFRFDTSAVGGVGLGLATSDPASGMFSSTNIPGSNSTDRGNAAALYGMLVGRVTSYGASVFVDNAVRQFVTGASLLERAIQTEFGFYGQDSWRITSTLTLNGGLRWEYQGAPEDPDNITYRGTNGFADVFGVSGTNNFFQPGNLPGVVPTFTLNNGRSWYNQDYNNFAPSIGLSWQPSYDNKWWTAVFGGPGKTVFRGGYSWTFTREGINNFLSIAFANPGFTGSLTATPVGAVTGAGQFLAGTVSLATANIPNVLQNPASFGPDFAISPTAGNSINDFAPDLNIPTVQSWSIGIQREITPDLVVELRYVGNHGTGLWRQDNVNEINIFENGFLAEFQTIQAAVLGGATNLCGATTPIITAALVTAGNCTNGTFVSQVRDGQAGSLANTLATSLTFWNNLINNANPNFLGVTNFWRVNPDARGGAFRMYNGTHTTYNSIQAEVRRRPAKGLSFTANYVYSKSLSNYFADSSVSFAGFSTLRNPGRDKGPSPFDLRHAFKANMIYELPFGPGKRWSSGQGWLNRVIEGWEISSIQRWQSGRVFNVTGGLGGTTTSADGGVQLIGITPSQIQNLLEIRKTPTGEVFWFPASLLDANQQRSNTTFLRPCPTAGAFCQRLFLYGPQFFRADWNIVKRTRITERVNFEFRAEFLNAYNNINFFFGGTPAATVASASTRSTSFGRVFDAYQDLSTTDDPGGRQIQFVFRVNF